MSSSKANKIHTKLRELALAHGTSQWPPLYLQARGVTKETRAEIDELVRLGYILARDTQTLTPVIAITVQPLGKMHFLEQDDDD